VTESVVPAERAILDTSVVIADRVAPIRGVLAISAITLAELNYGVLVAKTTEVRAERLRRLNLLQQRFDALPVDEAVSVSYGRLAAAVVEAGRQPRRRAMDLLIAATAHAHGARLYTRNASDFAGLEGLVDVIEV
jgi:toxin FitB